jgi:UDP-N-acetyl-D-glucosamine dehydrogenase
MPEYVLSKLIFGLNEAGKPLKGSKILLLGIAYKKNVDDMRESPAVEIMELVRASGGMVSYCDTHVPLFPKMRAHHFDLSSIPLSPTMLAEFDAVVLATNHAAFDYDMISENAGLIIDSRGVYRERAAHIIKA